MQVGKMRSTVITHLQWS